MAVIWPFAWGVSRKDPISRLRADNIVVAWFRYKVSVFLTEGLDSLQFSMSFRQRC